jgi:hypothetical protein
LSVKTATLRAVNARNTVTFPLDSALLLAGRKGLVQLAVNQEVAQDATWTPRNAIGPALDTAGVFFVDEDIATFDKVATVFVSRTLWNGVKLATQANLEQDEAVHTGFDEARKSGCHKL